MQCRCLFLGTNCHPFMQAGETTWKVQVSHIINVKKPLQPASLWCFQVEACEGGSEPSLPPKVQKAKVVGRVKAGHVGQRACLSNQPVQVVKWAVGRRGGEEAGGARESTVNKKGRQGKCVPPLGLPVPVRSPWRTQERA